MIKTDLKIIAGQFKNSLIKSPASNLTHPMAEKIRGAIFNMLGDISGLAVLDAYAGSGILGIESISRGARQAILIENNIKAYNNINQVIKDLKIEDKVSLYPINNLKWLKLSDQTFDIIFLDPPYDKVDINALLILASRVNQNGVIIISVPESMVHQTMTDFKDFIFIKQKSYGSAQILFFKN